MQFCQLFFFKFIAILIEILCEIFILKINSFIAVPDYLKLTSEGESVILKMAKYKEIVSSY